MIEIASTDLINLIDYRFRTTIDRIHLMNTPWIICIGRKKIIKLKSYLLLEEFERKYKASFITQMKEYNTINLWQKFKQLPDADRENPELVKAMRHYDHTVNVIWVMGHLNSARKYIDKR